MRMPDQGTPKSPIIGFRGIRLVSDYTLVTSLFQATIYLKNNEGKYIPLKHLVESVKLGRRSMHIGKRSYIVSFRPPHLKASTEIRAMSSWGAARKAIINALRDPAKKESRNSFTRRLWTEK